MSFIVPALTGITVFLTCSRVPILIAVFVLIYLHRRHTQKLAKEDAMDKTKSMDFGMEFGGATRSKTKPTHLTDVEKSDSRSRRQVSLDLDVASPYLLPAVLHNSRDTLNTLSATGDDRYGRPMTAGSSQHRGPLPGNTSQYTNGHDRDSSIYAHSVGPGDSPDGSQLSIHGGLLSGASPMPISTPPPPRKASLPLSSPRTLVPQINIPLPATRSTPPGLPSNQRVGPQLRSPSQAIEQQVTPNGLPSTLQIGEPSPMFDIQFDLPDQTRPISHDQSEYGEGPQFRLSLASDQGGMDDSVGRHGAGRKSLTPLAFEERRLSVGFRPLPPEGAVGEDAEERAMRIRSFYKEYFEDTSPAPPLPTQSRGPARQEDRHAEHQDDSVAVYDRETGRFVIPGAKPFAEPPTRRAMTPPPRMPPRFGGGPAAPRAGSAASSRFMPPTPRSFSSASGAPLPRKPMAAPAPLHLLPSPSMFTDDAFASPIMFAPPSRIPSEGGPESPSLRGGVRPYSPSVSPHVPLASAFDELAVLPNPHSLRNSSTFTGLDFAPPRKFKNDDTMSDAGSIRSNKSGMSALQIQNIRNGAYRVSRIPQEVVPAKDAIVSNLKPTWDMRK